MYKLEKYIQDRMDDVCGMRETKVSRMTLRREDKVISQESRTWCIYLQRQAPSVIRET